MGWLSYARFAAHWPTGRVIAGTRITILRHPHRSRTRSLFRPHSFLAPAPTLQPPLFPHG